MGEAIGFAICADMTEELRAHFTSAASECWAVLDEREHEQVGLADVEFTPGEWLRDASPLRDIALRFTPRRQELSRARGSPTSPS